MSNKHLIVLTIGPVQSYISQARRTHDLFQGSRILSYLTAAGVKAVTGAEVIYPIIPQNQPAGQAANIPNRIVVSVEGDKSSATAIAAGMEKAIRERWATLSRDVQKLFLKWVKDKAIQEQIEKQWKPQVELWLELYWVVVPETHDYKASINYANQMLGGRKLLRNFPSIVETGRKDSITGEQGVLTDGKDDEQFWRDVKVEQRNLALLSDAERLSALSVIKRFGHERSVGHKPLMIENRYPSTSSIAAASFKYDVFQAILLKDGKKSADLLDTVKKFIKALLHCYDETERKIETKRPINPPVDLFFTVDGNFNPEHFPMISNIAGVSLVKDKAHKDVDPYWQTQFMCIDGDYLFEDTLITKTIAEYMPALKADPKEDKKAYDEQYKLRIKHLKPKVDDAQKALKDLLKAAAEFDILPPQPYLAILAMDGDRMGKTLGNFAKAERHKEFSETLATFARERVPQFVEQEHLGRLVYAGGDDVLALVSVRHALDVAEQLRAEFATVVTERGFTDDNGDPISASTGIAFVHHTHDLQSAVRAAQSAEKSAKDDYDRNAVAIKLLRRSGEAREMGAKWVAKDGIAIITQVQAVRKWFADSILGRNLPQDMSRIVYEMGGGTLPDEAIKSEIRRVVKRRMAEGTPDSVKEQVVKTLIWFVDHTDKLEDMQHWMTAARFIAQKEGLQ